MFVSAVSWSQSHLLPDALLVGHVVPLQPPRGSSESSLGMNSYHCSSKHARTHTHTHGLHRSPHSETCPAWCKVPLLLDKVPAVSSRSALSPVAYAMVLTEGAGASNPGSSM